MRYDRPIQPLNPSLAACNFVPIGWATMDRDNITKAQAKRIANTLFPTVNYLARQRMERRGFPPMTRCTCWSARCMRRWTGADTTSRATDWGDG